MAYQQFSHRDYTVGWICALPSTELAAAAAMLDEEHPVLPAADFYDTNAYILGRIGDHNVAITCLPAEATGKASAATVAKDMLRSFPSIRFGLAVGVGGGVPCHRSGKEEDDGDEDDDSEYEDEEIRDIRLGDVVVSLHSKTTEAVVQYELNKSPQEEWFVHASRKLNKPPNIVLNAVSRLRADHIRGHRKVPELLSKMALEYPAMAAKFRHQGSEKDRLFKADFVHIKGKRSCKACCGINNANLVRRKDRVDTTPKIHYGTIGSADIVMKDAVLRDQLALQETVLCFEMEAAGLMDSFPCLVIRGICDYADSHKNKIWQPYAAATAASYAKELLLVIPGQGVSMQSSLAKRSEFSMPGLEVVNKGLEKVFEQLESCDQERFTRYLAEDQRHYNQAFGTSTYKEQKNTNSSQF